MGFDFVNTIVQPPSGSDAFGRPASVYNPPSRVGFTGASGSGSPAPMWIGSSSLLFVNGILVATGTYGTLPA